MELTSAALWLNTAFAGYDMAILKIMHYLASILGIILTPLMKLVTLLGEKGALMFLLGIVLMCFKRTRKIGVCVFGAVGCGALITNFILKDIIARPRPFETVAQFKEWWQFIGSPAEDDFSFPSGHVTAISAAMVSLWIWKGKKFAPTAICTILVMMISRNYLMAHYPSDVLAAVIVGTVSAFIANAITLIIFRFVETHEDNTLCAFIIDFDIRDYIPKNGISIPKLAVKKPSVGSHAKQESTAKPEKAPKHLKDEYVGKHLKG